jgi:hypothetical protein
VLCDILANVNEETRELREFERRLVEAEREYEVARQRFEALHTIVKGMRQLSEAVSLNAGQQTLTGIEPSDPPIVPMVKRWLQATESRMAEPQSLAAIVRRIMADGETRTVEEVALILQAVDRHPGGDRGRQTINNRLSDLSDQGYLTRVGRGIYVLSDEARAEREQRQQSMNRRRAVIESDQRKAARAQFIAKMDEEGSP